MCDIIFSGSERKNTMKAFDKMIAIGAITLSAWSILYTFLDCFFELGNSRGILLFDVNFGRLNRHFDPFVMTVLTILVFMFWGKIPPYRNKLNLDLFRRMLCGFLLSMSVLLVFNIEMQNLFSGLPGFSVWYLILFVCIVVAPFGIPGAFIGTLMCSMFWFFSKGSVPALLFVGLVYTTKWLIFVVVNVLVYGVAETWKRITGVVTVASM